jgi:hypothetical protein
MSKRKRRVFSREFKLSAVPRVVAAEASGGGGAEYLRFGRTNSKFTNENKGLAAANPFTPPRCGRRDLNPHGVAPNGL